jgi:hypothetical protein
MTTIITQRTFHEPSLGSVLSTATKTPEWIGSGLVVEVALLLPKGPEISFLFDCYPSDPVNTLAILVTKAFKLPGWSPQHTTLLLTWWYKESWLPK